MKRYTWVAGLVGALLSAGCAWDVDPEDDIGSTVQGVTVSCGGRNYTEYSKTCPATANGQPLSPYLCRVTGVPAVGGTGLPNAYYIGTCQNGQYTRRKPNYYDQFVPGSGASSTWNIYVGTAGGGRTVTSYFKVRETPQPDVGQAFGPRQVIEEARLLADPPPRGRASASPTTTISCGGLTYFKQTSTCSGGRCKTDGTPTATSGGVPYTYYYGPCSGNLMTRRIPTLWDVWRPIWVPPTPSTTLWNIDTGTTSANVYFRAQPLPWYVPPPDPPDPGGDDTSDDDGEVCNGFGQLCESDADCQQGACAGSPHECYYVGAVGFPGGQDRRCCGHRGPAPSYQCIADPF